MKLFLYFCLVNANQLKNTIHGNADRWLQTRSETIETVNEAR